uniref:(northern house mosquito) hypothetical protein n=1 Tax=Culex pipiens TaxID=7175 RepID=A0A8D8P6F1_CULPI
MRPAGNRSLLQETASSTDAQGFAAEAVFPGDVAKTNREWKWSVLRAGIFQPETSLFARLARASGPNRGGPSGARVLHPSRGNGGLSYSAGGRADLLSIPSTAGAVGSLHVLNKFCS